MIEIFRLNIELIRQRFKIYGFFNIVSLLTVILSILFGLKFIQFKVGNYNNITIYLISFILITTFEDLIPKNPEKKIYNMKTFFSILDFKSIEKYYKYKNLVIIYTFLIFTIFPLDLNYFGNFTFFFMFSCLIIFLQIKIKNKFSSERYTTVSIIIKALLIIICYFYTHKVFNIPFNKILNDYTIIACLFVSLYLIKNTFKSLYKESNIVGSIYFLSMSKKIFEFIPNRDFMFLIRKNLLIQPIFTIIIVNIIIEKSSTLYFDSLFTYTISYFCAFVSLYIELLKSESMKLLYFYSCKEFKVLKKEKILSILCISLCIFIFSAIPLMFVNSFNTITLSYVFAIAIFCFVAFIIKISLEIDNDILKIINSKQIILIYTIGMILSIICINLFMNFTK